MKWYVILRTETRLPFVFVQYNIFRFHHFLKHIFPLMSISIYLYPLYYNIDTGWNVYFVNSTRYVADISFHTFVTAFLIPQSQLHCSKKQSA